MLTDEWTTGWITQYISQPVVGHLLTVSKVLQQTTSYHDCKDDKTTCIFMQNFCVNCQFYLILLAVIKVQN